MVAGGPSKRRWTLGPPFKPGPGFDESAEFAQDAGVDGGVGDHAASAGDFGATGLELGFDQGDQASAGPDQRGDGGENEAEGDERAVEDGEVEGGEGLGKPGGIEVARVDALHDLHAGILAKFPGELAASDIDARDVVGAVLEEAVGEASGGGPDVEGAGTGDVELPGDQGVFEFPASAADVAIARGHFEAVLAADGATGFVGHVTVDPDLAGEDGALGLFPTGTEGEFHQTHIQPHGVESVTRPGRVWRIRSDGGAGGGGPGNGLAPGGRHGFAGAVQPRSRILAATGLAALWITFPSVCGGAAVSPNRPEAEGWRAAGRLIDLHQHITSTPEHIARAVGILDRAGIGVAANLSGGTVTSRDGGASAFERNKALADRLAPGRFILYFQLDYAGWDEADFGERAARQVEEAHRLGAAGLKEFKRLGLYLRDGRGELIRIDDPKLDPVWRRCGELGMPVSIHVADPKAFWDPFDETNERWKELKDHRPWWFGDASVYPPREALLEALDRVIARHPGTRFVCVHFANNAEDLDWVERTLDARPNMHADLAARVPEIGRHPPERVHRLFRKHADRILFATDFQVHNKLILGSSGDDERPTDDDAVAFFGKHWRWLETWDRDFEHMTPIQGDWTISGIGLPAEVLRQVYFDNARRLLAPFLPEPVLRARRFRGGAGVDREPADADWGRAPAVWMDQMSLDARARPELATEIRALWTSGHLYLRFEAPYTRLTMFEPAEPGTERIGLWERDVVEAFIGTEAGEPRRYAEFQVAPNGMKLDLRLDLPERDFAWSSGFETAVQVDEAGKRWTATMKIPLSSLAEVPPSAGTRWRINLYRCDYANGGFLAWRPTLARTFHTPERFGILEFEE